MNFFVNGRSTLVQPGPFPVFRPTFPGPGRTNHWTLFALGDHAHKASIDAKGIGGRAGIAQAAAVIEYAVMFVVKARGLPFLPVRFSG